MALPEGAKFSTILALHHRLTGYFLKRLEACVREERPLDEATREAIVDYLVGQGYAFRNPLQIDPPEDETKRDT